MRPSKKNKSKHSFKYPETKSSLGYVVSASELTHVKDPVIASLGPNPGV